MWSCRVHPRRVHRPVSTFNIYNSRPSHIPLPQRSSSALAGSHQYAADLPSPSAHVLFATVKAIKCLIPSPGSQSYASRGAYKYLTLTCS